MRYQRKTDLRHLIKQLFFKNNVNIIYKSRLGKNLQNCFKIIKFSKNSSKFLFSGKKKFNYKAALFYFLKVQLLYFFNELW